MSQCVPSWDLDQDHVRSRSNSTASDVPMLAYELTWENGQLSMHGLGQPRLPTKTVPWEKPRATGTLESIVNQATSTDDLPPWLDQHHIAATMTMDALVPRSGGLVDCSARVGSCSGMKRARVPERMSSVSGTSATFGRDSQHERDDMDMGVGFTSTSPGNSSYAKATTADSVCHSRPQREGEKKRGNGKSSISISTKRSRAAAVHNQSERKRRDKINQRMKTLQRLVPNSNKTDKASMLDEVIDYLKQLQAQISMMSRMNMLPMAMQQQQLQMSMMGMGMGMGIMDINNLTRSNITAMSPLLSNPFMPITFWPDGSGDRLQPPPPMADPLSTFLASQQQPMSMDAYTRMAAMYQQQPPASSTKN